MFWAPTFTRVLASAAYAERYDLFLRIARTMAPLWPQIDRLGQPKESGR